jgi:uncharacterized membrane protein YdjX (TVP38/TMEM64 family)
LTTASNKSGGDWIRLLLMLLFLVLFFFGAWKLGFFQQNESNKVFAEAERVGGPRWLAPIFIVVYAALATFAIPVMPLGYGAGAVFGFWSGSLYIWIASMIGITAGYFLARGVLSGFAKKLLGSHHGKFEKAGRGNVMLVTFRTRLLPFLPGGLFTYAAAAAKVPAPAFLGGSALGIIPSTLLAAFVGDRFAASIRTGNKDPLWLAIGVAAALFALSFLPAIVKKMRK